MDKNNLRRTLKNLRRNILQPNADELLRNNFLQNINIPSRSIIGTYIPINSEINVQKLNRALSYCGHILSLPCIMDKEMIFRKWNENTNLVINKFGIKEPDLRSEVVQPQYVIVPILAFNLQKYRIGYGKGYYDRYFANNPCTKIGVAYYQQCVNEAFQEPHDIALDCIITDNM